MAAPQVKQTDPARPPKLLVGFDYSELATRALDQALRFSSSWPGTEIIVVQATDGPVRPLAEEDEAAAEARVLQQLVGTIEARFADLEKQGVAVRAAQASAHLSLDDPIKAITTLGYVEGVDLILVGGSEKGTVERLVLGSVAEGVLKKAPCSVLVCRERADRKEPRIDPPPAPGTETTLGRRHTYHHASRNAESNAQLPLVFPMH